MTKGNMTDALENLRVIEGYVDRARKKGSFAVSISLSLFKDSLDLTRELFEKKYPMLKWVTLRDEGSEFDLRIEW